MAGELVVEVDADASGSDSGDDAGPAAEGDGHADHGVDLLPVELFGGVDLDELGVPGSGAFLGGDLDGELLSDLGGRDGLVESGEQLVGSDDVRHGGVLDLVAVDVRFFRRRLVGGVVEPVLVRKIRLVLKADDLLRIVCQF